MPTDLDCSTGKKSEVKLEFLHFNNEMKKAWRKISMAKVLKNLATKLTKFLTFTTSTTAGN